MPSNELVVELGPNDLLLLRLKRVLTKDQRDNLVKPLEDARYNNVRAFVLEGDVDVMVLKNYKDRTHFNR